MSQAPYQLTPSEAAFIAGILDTRGTIAVKNCRRARGFSLTLDFGSIPVVVTDWLHSRISQSLLCYGKTYSYPYGTVRHPHYYLRVTDAVAIRMLGEQILPYLVARQQQWRAVLALAKLIAAPRQAHTLTVTKLNLQRRFAAQIRAHQPIRPMTAKHLRVAS